MSEPRKTTTTTTTSNATLEPGHRPENDTSVGGLLRQLTHEVPSLITKELALAKAEMSELTTVVPIPSIDARSKYSWLSLF